MPRMLNFFLKKIDTLKLEKKKLLVKLFDANELINAIKIENMTLIKNGLETKLNVAREQLEGLLVLSLITC